MADKAKDKKDKKAKGGGAADSGMLIRVSDHPRACRHVQLAKSWGALLGFAATLYLSTKAGVPTVDALGRALLGGVVARTVAWFCAVNVWRHLAVAELEAARRRLMAPAAGAE